MYWKPFRGGHWYVIGEPTEYNGTDTDVFQPFVNNDTCIVHLVFGAEQLRFSNVDMVCRNYIY